MSAATMLSYLMYHIQHSSQDQAIQFLEQVYMNVNLRELDHEGRSVLHAAVQRGMWGLAEILLRLGMPVDQLDGNMLTPLHDACKEGNFDAVKYLLQKGASVSAVDSTGSAALHFAAFSGNENIVIMLINANANVNAKCNFGWTPLHYAAEKGLNNIVDILLSYGAKIENVRGQRSPLEMAKCQSTRNRLEADLMTTMMNGFSL